MSAGHVVSTQFLSPEWFVTAVLPVFGSQVLHRGTGIAHETALAAQAAQSTRLVQQYNQVVMLFTTLLSALRSVAVQMVSSKSLQRRALLLRLRGG